MTPRRGVVSWRLEEGAGRAGQEYLLKRPFDVLLSAAGLLVTAPAFLLIALAITIEDRGPIFYTQERVGRGRQPFRLLKFRSMIPDAEARTGPAWASKHDDRITRVGSLLRRTAADELPQLVNILRGDISFVGPRSHRAFFAEKFSREVPGYAARYAARPGLTGLAQVFGRYDSSAQQKLRFDLLYLGRCTFALDVKLILVSFVVSFLGRWDERGRAKVRGLKRFMRLGVSAASGAAPRVAHVGGRPLPAAAERSAPVTDGDDA
jgi:lipopolysaccharide/colanic/teichoic acid biosynthesis glycosyltransferase